jgi:hypothetical protein
MNNIFRLILFIFVGPLLATVVFSKVVTSRNIFEKSLSFAIQPAFAKSLNLNCNDANCGFDINRNFKVYKNLSDLIAFEAPADLKSELEIFHDELIKKSDSFLNAQLCQKSPGIFATNLWIKNMEFEFMHPNILRDLHNIAALASGATDGVLKEKASVVCEKILSTVKTNLISPISATYEQEYSKLKLVLGFYLALTFISILAFYLYPKYKEKFS